MEISLGAGYNVKNNQDSNGAQHEGILMNSSNISVYFLLISKFLRKYTHLDKYNYPRDRKETLRKFYSLPIEFFPFDHSDEYLFYLQSSISTSRKMTECRLDYSPLDLYALYCIGMYTYVRCRSMLCVFTFRPSFLDTVHISFDKIN